jgi:CelD/BcsL family acetyltransferase involved in cellulose biosynthesis
LAALGEEWDELAALYGTPFLRHAWFSAFWAAFAGGAELRVAVLRRDGRLDGVFPLFGSGRSWRALANPHSQIFSPLARDEAALRELAVAVVGTTGELEVWALPTEWPALGALRTVATNAGRIAFAERLHTSPIVELNGDFATYHAGLGKGTRRWLGKALRRLRDEHDDVQFELVSEPSDAGAELEEGFALEAAGWKGRDGTAILSKPETAQFFRALGLALHDDGVLRLSRLRVDGRLAAFELQAVDGRRLWSLKGAYDESLRRYSPGLLLRIAVIERAFELGLETNELLGFDSDFKLKFANASRSHCVFRAYERTAPSVARYLYRRRVRPAAKHAYLRFGGLRARIAIQRALVRLRS